MRPLAAEEIVGLEAYAGLRDDYRQRVIAYKRGRRMSVGEKASLLFEDRETLRFQVQEMLWVERIEAEEKIAHEVAVYNELMPGPGELSATLFVEVTDAGRMREELDRLIGLDEHLCLVLGEDADGVALRARFDEKQLEEDRISAVQYVRFALDAEQQRRFADPACRARVRFDHPRYRREDEIPEGVRRSLVRDLREEPPPLLRPDDAPRAAPPRDRVLREGGGVRVLRPASARLPGHRIVESAEPGASLLDAAPELLAALGAELQRSAREVLAECGSARVSCDVEPGRPLRWHVYARPDPRG